MAPKARDDYKRETFKRPVPDYPKRDLDQSRGSGVAYDSRSVPGHRGDPPSVKDRYGVAPVDSRPSQSFSGGRGGGGGRSDDRDPRYDTSDCS